MKKLLTEFWYGNINPQDHKQTDPCIADLLTLMKRNRDALMKDMNEDQKEIFDTYENRAAEISGLCERDIFIYGFRLGMRFAIEALNEENNFEEL